jgi:hypothetical protein
LLKAFGFKGKGCPRRGAYRYLYRRPDPAGPAAQHGSAMHEQLEAYVRHGKVPTHKHALAAMREAPRPLTALPESTIRWQLSRPEVSYMGIMDFSAALLSRADMRTSPFFSPGDTIVVGDYKFVAQLKYALVEYEGLLVDPDTLDADIQSTMYASKYLLYDGFDDVWGKWIYVPTKTVKAKAHPVWVHFRKDRVAETMCEVEDHARQVHGLFQIRPKISDIPYNTGFCYAFNQACPHVYDCPRSTGMFNSDDVLEDGAPEEEEKEMSFKEDLEKLLAGRGASDVDDEPPPPPDEDDGEAPPPPGDEEGPPDAPDEEETRAAVAEEIAAQRAARGEVGKGFINPPEAPDTAPSTPEEAFERFGEKEEPKAPAFKFLKEHKPALLARAVELGLVEPKSKVTAAGLAKMLRAKNEDPEKTVSEGSPDLPDDGEFVFDGTDKAPAGLAALAAAVPTYLEDLPLIENPHSPEIDGPGFVDEGLNDVTEIDVTSLSDRDLEHLTESSYTAEAQGAPGAREVNERCLQEKDRRKTSIDVRDVEVSSGGMKLSGFEYKPQSPRPEARPCPRHVEFEYKPEGPSGPKDRLPEVPSLESLAATARLLGCRITIEFAPEKK